MRRAPTRDGHSVYLLGAAVLQMGGIEMVILRQPTEVNLKMPRRGTKVPDLRRGKAPARAGASRSLAYAAVRSTQLPR